MLDKEKFEHSVEYGGNHIDYSRYMLDNLELAMDMWELNRTRAETIADIIYELRDGDWGNQKGSC